MKKENIYMYLSIAKGAFTGMLLLVMLMASCVKDTGNYTYSDINTLTFSDFDVVQGYQALFGHNFKVNPTVTASDSRYADADNYTYEWSLRLGSSSAPPLRDSILSRDKTLNITIGMSPGTYTLQYKVKDKNTGVQFQQRTNLTVTTEVYEGFLVLSDVGNGARLDMLSYDLKAEKFNPYMDVLQKMNANLSLKGQPYQVLAMQYTNANITPKNYGIFVATSEGTTRLDQETLNPAPNGNLRYLFVGNVPTDFAPQRLMGELTFGVYPMMLSYNSGHVYMYATLGGYAFKYSPLNVYNSTGVPFKLSRHFVSNGTISVFYNEDAKRFVQASSYTATELTNVAASYNYPQGYDLIYMGKDYNNKAFAVLKDPATQKYWLMRFTIGSAQNYLQELLGDGIEQATAFALSPEWGYLFYNAGAKVYEYDLALQQSKLMLDKGNSRISFLGFQNFYIRLSRNNPNYKDWANQLLVGSFDQQADGKSNGSLEMYSVPPVNGPIQKLRSWAGFGKIVSVAYRER